MQQIPGIDDELKIRSDLRPGDLGRIVLLHGTLYAAENGFDETFEAYVAGPLAEFVMHHTLRERVWLAEAGDHLLGCIAIVSASPTEAQLRWFLVHPVARGVGLGRRLLAEAISFSRAQRYESILLWTVSELPAAAHLYIQAGFAKVESVPAMRWGKRVVEEKYFIRLKSPESDNAV